MRRLRVYTFLFIFNCSYTYAQTNIITTVAGGNIGNNVAATLFGINPYAMVPDDSGNVYIADASNHIIHKFNMASHRLIVVAGNGSYGYSGDGGPATQAQLIYPVAVALDKSNNLYVVDESAQCVRKINLSTGIITTVAGNGNWGFNGDNGPATSANLNNPLAIAIDTANNLYISDYSNNRIREVYASSGFINTIAGNDSTGFNGDSIRADSARLNGPAGIALDKAGNIYFVDQNNCRIRMIKASNDTIYTLSGGKAGYAGDGGPAAKAQFYYPLGVSVDVSGNIYVSDTYNNRIRKITISNDTIRTICGTGNGTFSGDGGLAKSAAVFQPHYLAFDASGNLFIADMGNNRIREMKANDTINTISGDGEPGYNGNDMTGLSTQLSYPTNVASDDSGNIYIADNGNNMIREINNRTGNVLKIAGTGLGGFSGDGGPAGKAELSSPNGVATDASGNIYVADYYNNRIREINARTNTITTIAGNGTAGYAGDVGFATNAELYYPANLAIDSKGDVFIADMINDRIREISISDKRIRTVAGDGYNAKTYGGGFSGDSGKATSAELYQPHGVAVDDSGNLYIADTWNYRVRKVNTSGIITTVAGNGTWGYAGDGGPATSAELSAPTDVALDAHGNLYITDFYNNVVREVSVWDGSITTVAGTGTQSYGGDGGNAINAYLDLPNGLCFDPSGNLYIADYGNNRIRKINTPTGINNLKETGNIFIYPNPSSGNMYINISGFNSSSAILEVDDITGRSVMQKDINNTYSSAPIMLNISELPPGMYFISMKSNTQKLTAKIIKK